jgi:hypothetical protein
MAKRKKNMASKPAMVISENRKQAIFFLAEKIAMIAPATTLGKGFCVRSVAEDMDLPPATTPQTPAVSVLQ